MSTHVLIVGASTRAAAASAARAGFQVTAIDAFADVDQHPGVRALSVPRDFGVAYSASHAVSAASTIAADAVAYLSNLDNAPDLVATLAAGRRLWGNSPASLRRARDPFAVAESLTRAGLPVPALARSDTAATAREWIVKPFASGGGHGVRRWRPGAPVPSGAYLQEFIDGRSLSIVFVSAGGRAMVLGISAQLVGDAAFGAAGYRYAGNILLAERGASDEFGASILARASAIVRHIAAECDLVGVGGIDFVVRDGCPYPVDINPRWTASMELVERARGVAMFGVHAAACTGGGLPATEPGLDDDGAVWGKAIVYARSAVVIADTNQWAAAGNVADLPHAGERIDAGRPVCTVFAAAADGAACYAALVDRAAQVYVDLDAWAVSS